MRNIRFPDLDITGMWVLAVGVFFHLIARLVRKQPELAVQPGKSSGWVWWCSGIPHSKRPDC